MITTITTTATTAPKFVNTKQLAEMLDVEPDTIEVWRRRGEGPPFVRLGDGKRPAIRYAIDDVNAWLESRKIGGAS